MRGVGPSLQRDGPFYLPRPWRRFFYPQISKSIYTLNYFFARTYETIAVTFPIRRPGIIRVLRGHSFGDFVHAEAVRFELTDPVKSLLFSRQVPSTTQPRLRNKNNYSIFSETARLQMRALPLSSFFWLRRKYKIFPKSQKCWGGL